MTVLLYCTQISIIIVPQSHRRVTAHTRAPVTIDVHGSMTAEYDPGCDGAVDRLQISFQPVMLSALGAEVVLRAHTYSNSNDSDGGVFYNY